VLGGEVRGDGGDLGPWEASQLALGHVVPDTTRLVALHLCCDQIKIKINILYKTISSCFFNEKSEKIFSATICWWQGKAMLLEWCSHVLFVVVLKIENIYIILGEGDWRGRGRWRGVSESERAGSDGIHSVDDSWPWSEERFFWAILLGMGGGEGRDDGDAAGYVRKRRWEEEECGAVERAAD
jgi:hypothetical protein